MGKRYKYSFAKGETAAGGVESMVLAGISALLFVAAVLISFFMKGKGGNYLGALGLFSMLSALFGFFWGFEASVKRTEDIRAVFSVRSQTV